MGPATSAAVFSAVQPQAEKAMNTYKSTWCFCRGRTAFGLAGEVKKLANFRGSAHETEKIAR